MPLIKKDELQDIAHKLKAELSEFFKVQYDEKGSVGKRYRRFDEGGTPFCVTVDFDGLEDQTVTVRDRDTMEQDRVALSEVENYIREKIKTWKPED